MIRHVSTGARGGPDVAEDALDSFSDGFKIGSALLEALMFGPFGFLLAPVLTFHYHVTLGPGSGCGAYLDIGRITHNIEKLRLQEPH